MTTSQAVHFIKVDRLASELDISLNTARRRFRLYFHRYPDGRYMKPLRVNRAVYEAAKEGKPLPVNSASVKRVRPRRESDEVEAALRDIGR